MILPIHRSAWLCFLLISGACLAAEAPPPSQQRSPNQPGRRPNAPHKIPAERRSFQHGHPWGPPRSLNTRQRYWVRGDRGWYRGNQPYYGNRTYYFDGFTYRFGMPYDPTAFQSDLEQAYRQGVTDGRNEQRFREQAERGLTSYQRAMADGREAFGRADYSTASRAYLLAAQLNQGDPVSRLEAAQAQIALGRCASAGKILRRAFAIEPRIAYLPLNLRDAYAKPSEFDAHLGSLRKAAQDQAEDVDILFALAFCEYFAGDSAAAKTSLDAAQAIEPGDSVISEFRQIVTLSTPE